MLFVDCKFPDRDGEYCGMSYTYQVDPVLFEKLDIGDEVVVTHSNGNHYVVRVVDKSIDDRIGASQHVVCIVNDDSPYWKEQRLKKLREQISRRKAKLCDDDSILNALIRDYIRAGGLL